MTRGSIREYAAALRGRYAVAGKSEKGKVLDEFCQVTGYHRKAAVRLLRAQPRTTVVRGHRPVRYGAAVQAALVTIWEATDRLCGKRLAPLLSEVVPGLERHGSVTLQPAVREQVVDELTAVIRVQLAECQRQPLPHRMDALLHPRLSLPPDRFDLGPAGDNIHNQQGGQV